MKSGFAKSKTDLEFPGKKYGEWTLIVRLGGGGNGEVWEVQSDEGSVYAIKILKRLKSTGIKRFRAEIDVLSKNTDIVGIIPLIDKYIDCEDGSVTPWYVMPKGIDFETYRKDRKKIKQHFFCNFFPVPFLLG